MVAEDGTELGALCVIDTEPRPGGLTELQQEGLRVLARSAVRRFVNEREALRSREEARERPLEHGFGHPDGRTDDTINEGVPTRTGFGRDQCTPTQGPRR